MSRISRADRGRSTGAGRHTIQSVTSQWLVAGASAALMIQVGGAAMKYGLFVAFARWAGVQEFGAFAYAVSWLQVLAMLVGLGLGNVSLRFAPRYVHAADWAGFRALASGFPIVIAAVGVGLAGVLGVILAVAAPGGIHGTPARVLGLALCATPLAALSNLYQELLRSVRRIVVAYLLPLLGQPLIAGLFVYSLHIARAPASALVLMGAMTAAYACIVAGQWAAMRHTVLATCGTGDRRYDWRAWFTLSAPLMIVAGFQAILAQSDTIVVGSAIGSTEAGLYTAASRCAGLVTFVLLAVNAVAAPSISALYAERQFAALRVLISRLRWWMLLPSIIVGSALVVLGGPLLSIFGPDFRVAWGPLGILVCGQVVNAAAGPVGYVLILTGKEIAAVRVYGIAALLNVILSVALVGRFGLVGAATGTAAATVIWNAWLYVISEQHLSSLQTAGV